MWICLDCNSLFQDPKHYVEMHNLDTPPYEEYDGCPYCGGAYARAHKCDCCGSWIVGDYIKTDDGKRYCDNCYISIELGGDNDE